MLIIGRFKAGRTEILCFKWNGQLCRCRLCYYGGYCIEITRKTMERYLDLLSFDVGWKITEHGLRTLLKTLKEHFDELVAKNITDDADRLCTAFDRTMLNRLFMIEEDDETLKISIKNGQTKVGITQIVDGCSEQVDELLFIPLMRQHFGAKLENFKQCLPYIMMPSNMPFYCASDCKRYGEPSSRGIYFSIRQQPNRENMFDMCGCTLCYVYPHICSCVFNEFQSIKLGYLEPITKRHAIDAMERFTNPVKSMKKMPVNICEKICFDKDEKRAGDGWEEYTAHALLAPLILWRHIGYYYIGAPMEIHKLFGKKILT